MTTRTTRLGLGLLGAGALALGLGVPAGAHISPDRDEVPAGGYTQVTFTVPHGCEESPTRVIAVSIPESIVNAAPQVVAGWDVETTEEELAEPIEGEGEPQTERVAEITWTAQDGNELDPHFRQVFTVGFKAPETVGERLEFPIVQTCVEGETAWIEETPEGGEEPEHPAPFVTVGEASGDGHGAEEEAAPDEAAAPADTEGDTSDTSDDDGGSDGLALGGLALGALGLAAGGTALLRTRSTS